MLKDLIGLHIDTEIKEQENINRSFTLLLISAKDKKEKYE